MELRRGASLYASLAAPSHLPDIFAEGSSGPQWQTEKMWIIQVTTRAHPSTGCMSRGPGDQAAEETSLQSPDRHRLTYLGPLS
jgi:hypothetical protein